MGFVGHVGFVGDVVFPVTTCCVDGSEALVKLDCNDLFSVDGCGVVDPENTRNKVS